MKKISVLIIFAISFFAVSAQSDIVPEQSDVASAQSEVATVQSNVVVIQDYVAPTQSKWLIGISGGGTLNQLATTTGTSYFVEYKGQIGYSIGIPVRYAFSDWFALQVEPMAINKNYYWGRTNTEMIAVSSGYVEETRNNTYLQIPVLARFSFGGKTLRGFTNVGFSAGYWADGEITTQYWVNAEDTNLERVSLKEKYEFLSVRDNRSEFSWVLGGGLEYAISKKILISLEARYYYGISDIQKDYSLNQIHKYNNTLGVQFGVMFNL
jgi:opacity protein-like surface antigen